MTSLTTSTSYYVVGLYFIDDLDCFIVFDFHLVLTVFVQGANDPDYWHFLSGIFATLWPKTRAKDRFCLPWTTPKWSKLHRNAKGQRKSKATQDRSNLDLEKLIASAALDIVRKLDSILKMVAT